MTWSLDDVSILTCDLQCLWWKIAFFVRYKAIQQTHSSMFKYIFLWSVHFQMPTASGLGHAEAKSQDLNPGLPLWLAGTQAFVSSSSASEGTQVAETSLGGKVRQGPSARSGCCCPMLCLTHSTQLCRYWHESICVNLEELISLLPGFMISRLTVIYGEKLQEKETIYPNCYYS